MSQEAAGVGSEEMGRDTDQERQLTLSPETHPGGDLMEPNTELLPGGKGVVRVPAVSQCYQ